MRLYHFFFVLLLWVSGSLAASVTCSRGVLNLQSISETTHRYIPIRGTVPLYWQTFLHPESVRGLEISPTAYMPIPGNWNGLKSANGKLPGIGWGTIVIHVIPPTKPTKLALKIPAIRTAYTLFVDSMVLASAGVPGNSLERSAPAYQPQIVTLPLKTEPYDLIFNISNFSNNKGGPWQPMYIGESASLYQMHSLSVLYDVFIAGLLFFFVIINLTNYQFNRTIFSRGVIFPLAGFTLAILIRTMLTGERILYFLLPNISSEFFVRVEYVALFSAGVLYHHFIHNLYRGVSSEAIRKYVFYAGIAFILLAILLPVQYSSNFVILFHVNIFVIMLYQIYLSYSSRRTYKSSSIVNIISIIVMFIAALHDMKESNGNGSMLSLSPLASFFVILVQTVLLTRSQANVYRERALMEVDLTKINNTLLRFVPKQIFTILGTTPDKVTLGMKKDSIFTIMFADIRGFTALSERMSPEMNYTFINRFLSVVTPVVTSYNGFINNFMGDAFVAVFPTSAVDAVKAAQEIQHIMASGDQFDSFMLKEPLLLGIGIDYGAATLGIQGGETRMENTLLGPTVRCASRLEELTKSTGAAILVSQRVTMELPESMCEGRSFGSDSSGIIQLQIYELYAGTDSAETKRKRRTEQLVNDVVELMTEKKYREALEILATVSSDILKYDRGITYLLNRVREALGIYEVGQ